ncbi:hypothetical protein AURDEDRAFT_175479 [Auricularia subglabra TFB-10046 SS5]|uniref:DUF6533 domain-containing protein n=1 Tax=Auricularia subglabra (strain TFB-10046 / SS5) TaxID=717982 RepID=J0WT90_AURST|nr:hypothetical protein AURDEDRAFT_175479 [Auricularia subglabra TFB-10046 SS5]
MNDAETHYTVTLRQLQNVAYVQVAAAAWLVYDIVLTIPLEVQHIWRRGWSIPVGMYLLCRYYALMHVCGVHVMGGIVTLLLILRLHSLYGANKRITSVLVTLFVGAFLLIVRQLFAHPAKRKLRSKQAKLSVGIETVLHLKVIPAPVGLGQWRGCYTGSTHAPRFGFAAWVVSMAFCVVIFGLTIYKMVQMRTVTGTECNRNRVLVVFVRDGSLVFALICSLELITCITTTVAPVNLMAVGIYLLASVYGIAMSRLTLNLRDSVKHAQGRFSIGEATTGFEFHVISLKTAV